MSSDTGTDSEAGATAPQLDQGQAVGSPSETDKATSDAVAKEAKDLRRKITDQAEENKDLTEIITLLKDNPTRNIQDAAHYYANNSQWPDDPVVSKAEEDIEAAIGQFDDAAAPHLRKLVKALEAKHERENSSLRAQLSNRPTQQRTDPLREALADEGINPFDPGFRTFEQGLDDDPVYQALKGSKPEVAAAYAAKEFKSKVSQNGTNTRVEDSRRAGTFAGGGRSVDDREALAAKAKDFDQRKHTIHDLRDMLHGKKRRR